MNAWITSFQLCQIFSLNLLLIIGINLHRLNEISLALLCIYLPKCNTKHNVNKKNEVFFGWTWLFYHKAYSVTLSVPLNSVKTYLKTFRSSINIEKLFKPPGIRGWKKQCNLIEIPHDYQYFKKYVHNFSKMSIFFFWVLE